MVAILCSPSAVKWKKLSFLVLKRKNYRFFIFFEVVALSGAAGALTQPEAEPEYFGRERGLEAHSGQRPRRGRGLNILPRVGPGKWAEARGPTGAYPGARWTLLFSYLHYLPIWAFVHLAIWVSGYLPIGNLGFLAISAFGAVGHLAYLVIWLFGQYDNLAHLVIKPLGHSTIWLFAHLAYLPIWLFKPFGLLAISLFGEFDHLTTLAI